MQVLKSNASMLNVLYRFAARDGKLPNLYTVRPLMIRHPITLERLISFHPPPRNILNRPFRLSHLLLRQTERIHRQEALSRTEHCLRWCSWRCRWFSRQSS